MTMLQWMTKEMLSIFDWLCFGISFKCIGYLTPLFVLICQILGDIAIESSIDNSAVEASVDEEN